MQDPRPVTALQLELLRVLWERGDSTVQQVHEGLAAKGRRLAPSTVGTLLARLERRGLVARVGHARPFAFRPLRDEAELRDSMLGELTEQLFEGDAGRLVMHLLGRGGLQPDELARVRELLERAEPGGCEDDEAAGDGGGESR